MDTAASDSEGAVAAGYIPTVYAEAAAESGDVIEWRPSGDVRYWHDDDVTQWSDEEDSVSLAAGSAIPPASVSHRLFETEAEKTDRSVTHTQTSDTANHGGNATCHLINANKTEGSSITSAESHPAIITGQAATVGSGMHASCDPAAGNTSNALQTAGEPEKTGNGGVGCVDGGVKGLHPVEAVVEAVNSVNPTAKPGDMENTAASTVHITGNAVNAAKSDLLNTSADSVDEVDAVHPRLSEGATRRRRVSHPAFVCDTCCRDTSGWQDCADHAYRSGHGLAARCPLCRLPAVRCRRRGRPGVWHRCVVVDTVRKMGARNVAALVAGSHLTAPRPWKLSCGECGTSFAAKTARLVRHVVDRGHSVHRHCELCLFPVFVFGLNDERREMHVCVRNSAWLRAEEGALLATASENDPACRTHLNGGAASEEGGDGQGLNGGASSDHHLSRLTPTGLNRHHSHSNGNAPRPGEDITSDYHHRHNMFKTANGTGHNYGHQSASARLTNNGEVTSGKVGSNISASSGDGRVIPLASAGVEHWPEERTPSCVAI